MQKRPSLALQNQGPGRYFGLAMTAAGSFPLPSALAVKAIVISSTSSSNKEVKQPQDSCESVQGRVVAASA
jgi:hypothetical protein